MKYPTFTYSGKVGGLVDVRSLVTVSGDSEVLIERCKNILDCNDIKCTVEAHGYLIDVWGSGLSLTSFTSGNAAVCGKIESVSVSRKGGDKRK